MKIAAVLALLSFLLLPGPAANATDAEKPLAFSAECEAALAMSALPLHLRSRATAYVLEERGFAPHAGENRDFVCVVTRNHPGSIVPQCFDEPGQRAILPRFLEEGRLLRGGLSFAEIKRTIEANFEQGAYQAVDRPGLTYMMSAYNYIFAPNAGKLLHIHPHVMFHAPDVAAEDVGNDFGQGMQNPGLPFVIEEGVHGYMVSMVARPADSAEVENQCAGELPHPPGSS